MCDGFSQACRLLFDVGISVWRALVANKECLKNAEFKSFQIVREVAKFQQLSHDNLILSDDRRISERLPQSRMWQTSCVRLCSQPYCQADMASPVLLPGQKIPSLLLPPTKKGILTLGPGLRHTAPSTITATTAGFLSTDQRKGALWLESIPGRYSPSHGDLIVAQIHHSAADAYYCSLTPHTTLAILGHLSFEGASRKTRPQLKAGDLVYARISKAVRGDDVEIECVNPSSGKAEGLGPLKGGMVFSVTPAFARRLMMPGGKGGVNVLEGFGDKLQFEIAVGRNGTVWIDSASVRTTLAVGELLVNTEENGWTSGEQTKSVRKVIQALNVGG